MNVLKSHHLALSIAPGSFASVSSSQQEQEIGYQKRVQQVLSQLLSEIQDFRNCLNNYKED